MPKLSVEEKIAAATFIRDTYLPIPHLFVRDMLGANTWSMQDEIVKSTFRYKTTAVKTCNSIGKSFIAARIAVTFLTLLEGSIVVTTAPTWRQVTDVLWREIATTVKRSRYKLTSNEVRQAGLEIDKDWYAVGLSTKYPENFFGYHANHILVIVDEAGGVPEPIFKGVKAITPNANAHVLYIGNPTNPSGPFFEAFDESKPLPIKRFTISAFDTPNFTANGITDLETLLALFTPPKGVELADHFTEVQKGLKTPYAALIDPGTVFERYHEWGTDSSAWQALIMGQFPTQAEQSLLPLDLVIAATKMAEVFDDTGKTYRELMGWNIPDGPKEYGIDMARFGSDNTVVTPRHGGWVEQQIWWGKTDLMTSADKILKIIDPLDSSVRISIDDTGNGGGTTDRLRQISREEHASGRPSHQYHLAAYNFSSKEFMSQPDKFHDITSELYWNLRTWFTDKKISIPNEKQLFNELVARRWKLNTSGKIQVESKDDYKKRTGGKSPDRSDSLALSLSGGLRKFYTPSDTPRSSETYRPVIRPMTSGVIQRF